MSLVIKSLASFFVCVVLVSAATSAEAVEGPIAYFSDQVPVEFSKPTLPSSTDQVTVAKVRVMGRPALLLGPDQSGRPSGKMPKEPYSAMLKVLDVIRGKPPEQGHVSVTFGTSGFIPSYALGPSTPRQLAQEYYVAMHQDAFGFHLIGYPIDTDRYREWQREISEFERDRLRSPPK
jgi:hypothetical protein